MMFVLALVLSALCLFLSGIHGFVLKEDSFLHASKAWHERIQSSHPDDQAALRRETDALGDFIRTRSAQGHSASRVGDLSSLDTFIPEVMKCQNLPSVSISIVQNGSTLYSKGFGIADAATGAKADDNTVYGIGSCSKAFTSLLAAMLIEKGEIPSSGRVADLIPGWKLSENEATSIVTLKDLLSHRTGMPRHDLAIFSQNLTRAELVYRARYMNPATTVRDSFLYNNLMYATAGYALGLHSTQGAWEKLVQELIFDRLNMTRSFPTFASAQNVSNRAGIAYWDGSAFVPGPWEANLVVDPVAPAGSVNSNARDMAKWMNVHLQQSSVSLNISNASIWSLHQAVNSIPRVPPTSVPIEIQDLVNGDNYGLGWFRGYYRGYKRVFHGGDVSGFHAMVSLIPDMNLGVAVLTNSVNPGVYWRDIIVSYATDLALGLVPLFHNSTEACKFPCQYWPSGPGCTPSSSSPLKKKSPTSKSKAPIISESPPSPPDYMGQYSNPAYGQLTITLLPGNPVIISGSLGNYPYPGTQLNGQLTWTQQGDVFQWGAPSTSVSSNYTLSFTRNKSGSVVSVTLSFFEDVWYNIVFTSSSFNLQTDQSTCSYPSTAGVEFVPYTNYIPVPGPQGEKGERGYRGTAGPKGDNSKWSSGAVAGMVVGVVAFSVLLSVLVAYVVTKRLLVALNGGQVGEVSSRGSTNNNGYAALDGGQQGDSSFRQSNI